MLWLAGYRAIYEVYSKLSALWFHDLDLGRVHLPGSRGDFVGRVLGRSSPHVDPDQPLGRRGPEASPLPPGGKRVLVLGD